MAELSLTFWPGPRAVAISLQIERLGTRYSPVGLQFKVTKTI